MSVYEQAQLYQATRLTSHLCSQTRPLACLEAGLDDCPRLRVPGGLLPQSGEIALGYLGLGYRPIPLIPNKNGSWISAIKWVSCLFYSDANLKWPGGYA